MFSLVLWGLSSEDGGSDPESHVCLDGETPGTSVEQAVPDSRARPLRLQSSAFKITSLWTRISGRGAGPCILEGDKR